MMVSVSFRGSGCWVFAAFLLTACGSTTPAPESDGGVAADGGRRDGGFLDLDAGPRTDGGDSGVAPDGWATFEGIPGCPLTYPVRADAFPPPLQWVDCPTSLNLPGACKRIALDFPDAAQTGPVLLPQGVDVHDGGFELTFQIFHPSYFEWRGVDGSGKTQTLLKSQNNRCGPGTGYGPVTGSYAIHAYSEPSRQAGALLIGDFAGTPKVAKTYATQPAIVAFKQRIIELGRGLHLIDWTTGRDTLLADPNSPAFSDVGQFQEVGTRLYGRAGNPYNVYEYSTGTPKKILQAGRDAGDVGAYAATETRIFWTNVSPDADRQGTSEDALYTQELAPDGTLTGVRHKLPTPGRQGWSSSAKFGCNILVRPYLNPRPFGDPAPNGSGGGLEVFNFTTMKHWRLLMPTSGTDKSTIFGFNEIKLVTCSEVVASVNHYDPLSPVIQQNFARFDLSKLGPGEPFAMTPDPVP
jgi:hypothetical protein